MEWIQRNPKKAIALAALAVLVVVVLIRGMSGGSGSPSTEPILSGPSLATPTTTPTHRLTVLPTPSGTPTSIGSVMSGFPASGMGGIAPGMAGNGLSNGLPPHRVVIAAGSDGPLLGVGWRIPTADGGRSGKDTSYRSSFRHVATAYGKPDYAQLYTMVGPDSTHVWCTVTVDGRVTERQDARGPWSQVFCQG